MHPHRRKTTAALLQYQSRRKQDSIQINSISLKIGVCVFRSIPYLQYQSYSVLLLAKIALAGIAFSARGIALMESKSIFRRMLGRQIQVGGQMPYFAYAVITQLLFISIPVIFAFMKHASWIPYSELLNSQGDFLYPHRYALYLIETCLLFPFIAGLYLSAKSQRITPHRMLWLACCDAAHLNVSDVASITKSAFLVEAYRKSGAYWYTLSDKPFAYPIEFFSKDISTTSSEPVPPSS